MPCTHDSWEFQGRHDWEVVAGIQVKARTQDIVRRIVQDADAFRDENVVDALAVAARALLCAAFGERNTLRIRE